LNNAFVGPGIKEPQARTHEYLQEVAMELARYRAVHEAYFGFYLWEITYP